MNLANYVLAAMLSWYPVATHDYTHVSEHDTLERYISIADDIVVTATETPLFAGDDGVLKTAMLSASVAGFESGGFRAEVDDCELAGDAGAAWSLWQLHRPKEVICGTRRNAARMALAMMADSLKWCASLPQMERLAIYTSGSCGRGRAESRHRWERAARWLAAHPLVL